MYLWCWLSFIRCIYSNFLKKYHPPETKFICEIEFLLFTNSLSLKELEQKTIIPISIPMVKCHFFTESTDHVHMHLLQFMALRSTQFGGHPSTSWSINFHLESKIKIKQQNQHQKYTWIIGNLTFIIIIKRSILIIINIYRLHSRIVILQRFQPCKSCLNNIFSLTIHIRNGGNQKIKGFDVVPNLVSIIGAGKGGGHSGGHFSGSGRHSTERPRIIVHWCRNLETWMRSKRYPRNFGECGFLQIVSRSWISKCLWGLDL